MDLNRKVKSGFTLVELLAIILVLSIIINVVFSLVDNVLDEADNVIDNVVKNDILESAESYALEYKNTELWKEQIVYEGDDDKRTSFCVSLDTLIDTGYFKNDDSNYDEYRNKYAVKAEGINGIYSYKFVELEKLEDNDICKYYRRSSELIDSENGNMVDEIEKELSIMDDKTGENLGDFEYKITSLNNSKYIANMNFDINLFDVIENNSVYVSVVLDKSGSMNSSSKFGLAKQAALSLSEILSENEDINAKMALIEFGRQAVLRRDFGEKAFTSTDFTLADGAGTNVSAGLDLVSSLIYNGVISDNSNVYTILLFDGAPYDYSKMKYVLNNNTRYIYPKAIYDKNKNYNIVGDADIYYKNYQKSIVGCNDNSNCSQYTTDLNEKIQLQNVLLSINNTGLNEAWQHLTFSSGYLKALNSKLIVIGYGMDFGNNAKNIASVDDKLCSNSLDKKHCYYFKSTGDDISKLFNDLADSIIKYSTADQIKLTFESVKSDAGNSLINIYDLDGNELNNVQVSYDLQNIELEDGNLNFDAKYQFEVSDYLYKRMECGEDICSYNETDQLLNISLELIYPDGSSKKIEIEQPRFEINLYKESMLN